jgi:hypothetical protein
MSMSHSGIKVGKFVVIRFPSGWTVSPIKLATKYGNVDISNFPEIQIPSDTTDIRLTTKFVQNEISYSELESMIPQ